MNCPVPENQLPINEYNKLTSAWDFSWACKIGKLYYKFLFKLQLCLFLFFCICLNFLDSKYQTGLYSLILSTSFICLICLRTYLGFRYIYVRLLKSALPYEESSWYDGQVWVKNLNYLIKDRLIADYTVLPILSRLKISFIINFSFLVSLLLTFIF